MELWLFLGGFLAVLLVVVILAVYLVRKYRQLKNRVSRYSIISAFVKGIQNGELDFEVPEEPKSLNRCDKLLIPQILKDFPDMDIEDAKNMFKAFVRQHYKDKNSFTIYAVGLSQYRRTGLQKVIVMQASASYTVGGKKKQIRCEADYAYRVETDDETIAANCPNCGGVIGYGVVVCPYCDSRVGNVMGNTWKFVNIRET